MLKSGVQNQKWLTMRRIGCISLAVSGILNA